MTNDTMPKTVWIHYTLDYVSDKNTDGQCTKYLNAAPLEDIDIEALREALDIEKLNIEEWGYAVETFEAKHGKSTLYLYMEVAQAVLAMMEE